MKYRFIALSWYIKYNAYKSSCRCKIIETLSLNCMKIYRRGLSALNTMSAGAVDISEWWKATKSFNYVKS